MLSVLVTFCENNPPDAGGFRHKEPVKLIFDIFSDVKFEKLLRIHNWPVTLDANINVTAINYTISLWPPNMKWHTVPYCTGLNYLCRS